MAGKRFSTFRPLKSNLKSTIKCGQPCLQEDIQPLYERYLMLNLIVIILLICGLIFFTGGSIGIIRMPDFYTRLHPAGKLDTAGQFFTMSAIALFLLQDFNLHNFLIAIKIVLIVIFVFITSPTATHAIVDAGVRAGLSPWTKKGPS